LFALSCPTPLRKNYKPTKKNGFTKEPLPRIKRPIRNGLATIEGLAFPSRSSREPGLAGRRGCMSEASSAAAEKGGEGTALKT